MRRSPLKASVELVRQATGQDLSDLDCDEFITAVERLSEDADGLQAPHPQTDYKIVIRLKTPGFLEAAVLAAVVNIEKKRRLN